MIGLTCPHCGQLASVPAQLLGSSLECPHCGTLFTAAAAPLVPEPEPGRDPASGPENPPPNRRTEQRYRCRRPQVLRLEVPPAPGTSRALLWDVSVQGLALVAEQVPEVGAVFSIRAAAGPGGSIRVLTARVRHHAFLGEGYWLVGCSLSRPLTEEALLALL